jgi:uncharacterized protein
MGFLQTSLAVLCFWVLAILPARAQNLPSPTSYVSDFAQIFSSQFKADLNQRLAKLETDTTNQIAVVTVDSLEDMAIEDYAVRLFEKWQIGQKSKDNGLLLLIAPKERQMRIEVGYGLEPVITDGRAGEIIRNDLTPQFKANDYEKGVSQAIDRIESYLANPSSEEPSSSPSGSSGNIFTAIMGLFITLFFLYIVFPLLLIPVYLAAFLARSKSYYLGGILGFILGLIFHSFIAALILALIGLVLDYILSRNYKILKSLGKNTGFLRSRGGFWTGGSHSGGGGFGGFGGGRSGGGGASGSW